MKDVIVYHLRRHVVGLIMAVVVGLLMISSTLAVRFSLGAQYRGIAPILSATSLDSAWYHAVIKEAMEGGKPWNAILFENKAVAYPVPDLAERLMAVPGRLFPFSASAAGVLLFWRFILPAFLAIAIYVMGYALIRSRLFAIASSLASICLSYIVQEPARAIDLLRGTGQALLYTIYDRPVHPQFEAPLVWIFLGCAVQSMKPYAKRSWWIVTGMILGLLTYTYVWAWTWGYAALAFLIVQAFVQNDPRAARAIGKAWALGGVIGLPEIISLILTAIHPGSSAYLERLALNSSYVPAAWWLNLALIAALTTLFVIRQRLEQTLRRFCAAGLGAIFIAVNQQVVTGHAFQPDHYMELIGSAFCVWVFCLGLWEYLRRQTSQIRMLVFICLGGFSILIMSIWQVRIFEQSKDLTLAAQPFAEVAAFLNREAPTPSAHRVVFANQAIGLLVLVYTNDDLWWQLYAMAVPTDQHRIEQSAFTWFVLLGIQPADLYQAALNHPLDVTQWFTLTTDYDQRLSWIRDHLSDMLQTYQAFRQSTPLTQAIRAQRVDYILFDKQLDHWDPSRLGVGKKLMENERFILYRMP